MSGLTVASYPGDRFCVTVRSVKVTQNAGGVDRVWQSSNTRRGHRRQGRALAIGSKP